ncbi:MAG: YaaL family protein [Lactobacillus sp.]|nr:YaaL family protein [Lactobacillus sp.]
MFGAKKPTLRQQADNKLLDLAFYLREGMLSYQEADILAANKHAEADVTLLIQKAKYDFVYRQIRARKIKSQRISPDMFF